jgi:teichuronic acid biosynthesis glycosyltransferase TuaC
MRVATVTTFFPNSADPHRAVFVANLVRAMRRRCEVDVISPVPFAPPLRAFPAWYAQSRIPRRESIDGTDVDHPRFLAVPKADFTSGLTYALAVLPALRRLDARGLVVHAHCAYPDGVGVALAARRLGLPYAITAHGSDINVYARRRLLRWQIRRAMAGAAAIIAVSSDLRGKLSGLLGPAAAVARLHHVPCAGYDPAVFFPRERPALRQALGLAPGGRLALFVGQLVPIKAVDRLIEAWRRLHAEGRVGAADRLVLVGEGRCRAELEAQARAGGVADRVTFAGALPQAAVARWMGAADLLCLPSRNEGTPNVVVEALASGVPVVASRVGGVPELVADEDTGLLVPPGDASALAGAIAGALGRAWDPERVRLTVAHLTWERIAAQTVACLSEIERDPRAAVA